MNVNQFGELYDILESALNFMTQQQTIAMLVGRWGRLIIKVVLSRGFLFNQAIGLLAL